MPVEESEVESKYQKNKRTKSQKQKDAEERKLSSKAAKRAKLDPENVKTVSDLQSERQDSIDVDFDDDGGDDQEHENEAEDEDVVDDEDTYEDGSNDADADDDESNFEEHGVKESVQPSNDQMQVTSSHSPQLSSTRRASIAQLRERLHNKIQMLHHKRQSQKTDGTEEPSTKQELLEARRRQRGEMRDNRRRERKEARRQAKANASANAKTSNDAKSSATSGGSSRSAGLLVEDPSTSSSATEYAGMPLDGKLSFSQVSFETRNAPDTARKNKYALPSDPKAALAALEARKRKEEAKIQKQIERGQDASQAREAANEAERWGKAMAASEGVRIRDNVHVLKQTLKRRERSKEKSAKSWNERRKAEQEAQAAKQKRRMENLSSRREAKKTGGKSNKSLRSPSRARPGFEGSSRSFSSGHRKSASGSSSGGGSKSSRPSKR